MGWFSRGKKKPLSRQNEAGDEWEKIFAEVERAEQVINDYGGVLRMAN